jgi:hypothetical protein
VHLRGLSQEEPDSDVLHYERLSGRFVEYPMGGFRVCLDLRTREKIKSVHDTAAESVRFGVTSMHIMSTTLTDESTASRTVRMVVERWRFVHGWGLKVNDENPSLILF